jgi:hypothetical protein
LLYFVQFNSHYRDKKKLSRCAVRFRAPLQPNKICLRRLLLGGWPLCARLVLRLVTPLWMCFFAFRVTVPQLEALEATRPGKTTGCPVSR